MITCNKGEVNLSGNTMQLVAECMTIMNAMNTRIKKDPVLSATIPDITMLKLAIVIEARTKADFKDAYEEYPEPVKAGDEYGSNTNS